MPAFANEMLISSISTISVDFFGFYGFPWISGVGGSQPVPAFADEMLLLKKLHSIPAGCYFIDVHGFHEIPWVSMDFRGPKFAACASLCGRYADFIDFHDFRMISMDFRVRAFAACAGLRGRGAALLKETFTRSQLAIISSIFMDFMRFHGFPWISGARGSQLVPAFAGEMLISSIFMISKDCWNFLIPMNFRGRGFAACGGLCGRDAAPQETST